MTRPKYVITTCGNRKLPQGGRAEDFYHGSFVQSQRAAARALNPIKGFLILSNKHGYMDPSHWIDEPYDSHFGYPDTMSDEAFQQRIAQLDLRPGDVVACLGARVYAEQTRRLFPSFVKIYWLPKHLPDTRMGFQVRLYQQIVEQNSGHIPFACEQYCEFTYDDLPKRERKQ